LPLARGQRRGHDRAARLCQAGNFHTARLVAAPLGHFFNVMSNGYGAMPDYARRLTPEDRWAIVAYIKALQLSQNAKQADVASGSHVEPLTEIEEREGFAPDFAADWACHPTAVYGTPNHEDYVLPGNGSAPATSGPVAAPAATGADQNRTDGCTC
jgi:hypothetical protein